MEQFGPLHTVGHDIHIPQKRHLFRRGPVSIAKASHFDFLKCLEKVEKS
jgi:hypothetical protein